MLKLLNFKFAFVLLYLSLGSGLLAQDTQPQEISTATRSITKQEKRTVRFEEEGVYFSNEFDGARMNDIERTDDGQFVISILPENEPINMSPWYAFRVWSKKKKEIFVRLVYPDFAVHRYDPKVSGDGKTWTPIERERITDIEKGSAGSGPRSRPKSVIIRLSVSKKPLWVSAQELETTKNVFEWIGRTAKKGKFQTEDIGKSREGRPIRMLKIGNTASKNMMLIISRQHPPEVTGYFVMRSFVEKIADKSELSRAFRKDWGIYVIPLMNPDGVDAGAWRHNDGGVDLNRDWSEFNQPETRAVRDFLRRKTNETGGKFYFGIDFHSTWNDIYYPFSNIYEGNMPGLVDDWIANIQTALPGYEPNIQGNSTLLPTRVSRNYFFDAHGMEAIVFEIGDNTPRDFIHKKGEVGAEELMKLLASRTK